MKILFIANGFPPARWAGTETYTAAVAGELLGRGHHVQVLCCGEWEKGSNYWNGYIDDVYKGIPVRRINLNWQKSPDTQKYLYNNPIVANFLYDYLKEFAPDLVHVTSCETLSASVLETVKKQEIPLVLSITDFWFLCPTINLLRSDGQNCSGKTTPWECLQCISHRSKPYQWIQRIFPEKGTEVVMTQLSKIPAITRQRGFRGMVGDMADRKEFMRYVFSLPDVRLVASEFVRDVHLQNGFDDPIDLHPYGHDMSWLKNFKGGRKTTTLTVGFIGRISRSKGVHLLLKAAQHLKDAVGDRVNFLIYGNMDQHAEYARRLEELAEGLDNVKFCGTYPREMSADVFSKMDVLAVPSLWYDFPLIIHEAFATKTPVIATNLGGMAETVKHEKNGLLFERGNVNELAHQIKRFISEPSLLEKLKGGISKVKTVEEEVNELERIYLKLMSLALISLKSFNMVGSFFTENL